MQTDLSSMQIICDYIERNLTRYAKIKTQQYHTNYDLNYCLQYTDDFHKKREH